MRYKMIVAYDGTDYHGWQEQAQKNMPTIVGTMQKKFFEVFHQNCVIVGASRTDAGVHACEQVATFTTDLPINPSTILTAWNNKLPAAIFIKKLTPAPDHYNPHIGVVQKEYRYTWSLERPDPFTARFVWHYRWPVDLVKLQSACTLFVGTHDFRSFCTGAELTDTVRTIDSMCVEHINEHTYALIFKAKSFLHHMVRRITGACLEVASRPHLSLENVRNILKKKNPEHTLPCAPARGLTLIQITYQN